MHDQLKKGLQQGIGDAVGFLVGAGLSALLARVLGFDFLNEAGYSLRAMAGIAMVLFGGGLGLQAARRYLNQPASGE